MSNRTKYWMKRTAEFIGKVAFTFATTMFFMWMLLFW